MFRLPFKVYGAVITKQLNVIWKNEKKNSTTWNFLWKSSPKRHKKYKVINFAPINKSMANICGCAHDVRRSGATKTRLSECCYGLSDVEMPKSSPSKLLSVQSTLLFATRLFSKLHAWNASNNIRKTASQNRFFWNGRILTSIIIPFGFVLAKQNRR